MKDMDTDLDLTLERRFAASPAKVWRAMTEPDLLRQWFAPKPWRVIDLTLEAWPGGRFFLKMAGPNDEPEDCATEEDDTGGCVLVVEPERRLAWTDGLGAGFRPKSAAFMTADMRLEPDGDGTLYRVRVLHKDRADRDRHSEMGFADGWSTCASQLEEVARAL